MKQAPLFLVLLLLTACQRPTPEATPDHTAAIHQLEQGLLPATRIEGEEPAPATIHERMAHHKVPGLSIAFFEDGAIQWTRSYGYRSNDSLQAVDDNRLFQAASISNKCVTGCQIYLYHLEALRYKNLDRLGADCFLPFSVSRRCNTIDLFKLPGEKVRAGITGLVSDPLDGFVRVFASCSMFHFVNSAGRGYSSTTDLSRKIPTLEQDQKQSPCSPISARL